MMRGVLAVLLLATACGLSIDDFKTQANDARQCVPGDSCVRAGATDCLCASVVNSKQKAAIDDAAAQVSCSGRSASCRGLTDLRCGDDGLCTATLEP